MKHTHTLLATAFALLATPLFAQYNVAFLGVPGKKDNCFKLLRTSNDNFVMAGVIDNDAALYKYDCGGELTDSLRYDLPLANSFEGFRDVAELPNGEFVAVGYAKCANPALDVVLAVRTSANLQVLAADTFLIDGKNANAFLLTNMAGKFYLSGYILGAGLDFADVFWTSFSTTTLQPGNSTSVFSYGLDALQSATTTADGSVLLAGGAVLGNIFVAENPLTNIAFVRKIKPDGTLLWEQTREATFKNKYGRANFQSAHENPATGNVLAVGSFFTGDTLNPLDEIVALYTPNGLLLDEKTAPKPGSQRIHSTIQVPGLPGVFIAVGDSIGAVDADVFAGPFSSVFTESFDEIFILSAETDPDNPLSIRSVTEAAGQKIAFAGIFYNIFEANPATNHDVFVALPAIEVGAVFENCALRSTLAAGSLTYQWYLNAAEIPGATGPDFVPTQPGEYTVKVTDAGGCAGFSDFVEVPAVSANFALDIDGGTVLFTNNSGGAATYRWDFGDGTTSTEFNPTHTYAASGTYTVRLTATDSCGLISDSYAQTFGVVDAGEPAWLAGWRLFPNPNAGVFTLELRGEPSTQLDFSLFDPLGREVFRQTSGFATGETVQRFDLTGLPSATYFLQMRGPSGSKMLRVAIE